jgi:exonuclease III
MKLMLILERENLDILCVQETWMAAGAESPSIPGYRVME